MALQREQVAAPAAESKSKPLPARPSAPRMTLQDVLNPTPAAGQPWQPPIPDSIGPATPLYQPLNGKFPEKIPAGGYSNGIEAGSLNPSAMQPNMQLVSPVKPEAEEETANTRAMREDALGEKHGPVERMSWEEYNGLSDRQRAAVDFNSLLVQAVRKDRRLDAQGEYDDVTPEQSRKYDEMVRDIFGTRMTESMTSMQADRTSERYAPETLAVLDQLKLSDPDADLDDFLNLRAAITEDDIAKIEPERSFQSLITVQPQDAKTDRAVMIDTLVDNTAALQEQMAKGIRIMQSFRATAAIGRNETVELFGGNPNTPKYVPGYGQPDFSPDGVVPQNIDAYFLSKYDKLADARTTPEQAQSLLQLISTTLTPEELPQFYQYLDTRSRVAADNGTPLGDTPGVQYRNPQELRELLGYK